MMIDSTAVRAHRAASGAKRGERGQAIGRSRGGRTTKIHVLIDGAGRPLAFRLSGGNVADITLAAPLLESAATSAWPIGDKGDDADHLRALLDGMRIAHPSLRASRTGRERVPRSTVDWDTSQADDFRTRGGPWSIK